MAKIDDDISLEEFEKTYFYRPELVQYCQHFAIPHQGLLKADLEHNIRTYLQGEKKYIEAKHAVPHWRQDDLRLDAEVTEHYCNNQATRAFFTSVIGPHFRFNGAMMHYKKTHPDQKVTYQDLVEVWQQEEVKKKQGLPSTKQFYKANRYNEFVKQFYADPQNKGKSRVDMVKAWHELKISGKANLL
jgi:hypothetical protein